MSIRKSRLNLFPGWFCVALVFGSYVSQAITPAEVDRQLKAGEKILFIDVRPTALFTQGHVPNAINIPAALVAEKQLPPLGRVVVYDEGLGRDTAQSATEAFKGKPGITAEVLEGGFAAWRMAQSATTQSGGLRPESLPLITYHELKQRTNTDMVLVDLRQPRASADERTGEKRAAKPLTSLGSEFPNARVTHSPFSVPAATSARGLKPSTPPLLVLIDNGDGQAEEMARLLKAAGNTRFVILAGGESIRERKGQPGLQRAGATFSVPPSANLVTNTLR